MKNKHIGVLGIAAAFFILSHSTAFAYVSFTTDILDPNANAFTILWDFETGDPNFAGDNIIREYSLGTDNSYSSPPALPAPDPDNEWYLTIPETRSTPGTYFAEITTADGLPVGANYFGLYWGSIDTYNNIEFWRGATLVDTFLGTSVPPANGNQTIATYVNIFGIPEFDKVKLIATSDGPYAFELDNIAIADNPVPIPAAVWLLGSGLFGLVLVRRRK